MSRVGFRFDQILPGFYRVFTVYRVSLGLSVQSVDVVDFDSFLFFFPFDLSRTTPCWTTRWRSFLSCFFFLFLFFFVFGGRSPFLETPPGFTEFFFFLLLLVNFFWRPVPLLLYSVDDFLLVYFWNFFSFFLLFSLTKIGSSFFFSLLFVFFWLQTCHFEKNIC